MYRADDSESYRSIDFGSTRPEDVLYDQGVAFSPDANLVFAVTGNAGNDGGTDAYLRVLRS